MTNEERDKLLRVVNMVQGTELRLLRRSLNLGEGLVKDAIHEACNELEDIESLLQSIAHGREI